MSYVIKIEFFLVDNEGRGSYYSTIVIGPKNVIKETEIFYTNYVRSASNNLPKKVNFMSSEKFVWTYTFGNLNEIVIYSGISANCRLIIIAKEVQHE